MRILILCDHFGTGGGAGTIARLQAEELSKTHAVHVLTAHIPKNFNITNYPACRRLERQRLAGRQLPITNYQLDYRSKFRNYLGLYHPKAISVLKKYLSNNQFDLAITHNIFYNWSYASLDVLAKHKVKTIHVFHDVSSFTNNTKLTNIPYTKNRDEYVFDYHYPEWKRIREWWGGIYNPFRQYCIHKHLKQATKTVAVSQALADALRQNNIRVDGVVHNGISTNDQLRVTGYGLRDSILMVGRIHNAKGYLQAAEYLAYLKQHYQLTPKLRIAGNTDLANDLEAQKILRRARALGVNDQIQFLGWLNQQQLEHAFTHCGLLIVPSLCFDSFPTVILEAMQRAKPVVATIFGGAKEIITHGKTGYVEDPFNVPAFSERIRELLIDKEKNCSFGEAGRKHLQTEFSLETQTQKLLSIL